MRCNKSTNIECKSLSRVHFINGSRELILQARKAGYYRTKGKIEELVFPELLNKREFRLYKVNGYRWCTPYTEINFSGEKLSLYNLGELWQQK